MGFGLQDVSQLPSDGQTAIKHWLTSWSRYTIAGAVARERACGTVSRK